MNGTSKVRLRKACSSTSFRSFTSTGLYYFNRFSTSCIVTEVFNNEISKIAQRETEGASSNLNLAHSERCVLAFNGKKPFLPLAKNVYLPNALYTFSSPLIPAPAHRLIFFRLIASIYLAASSPVPSVFPLSANFHVRRNCYF